jgi:hypothetical protein
MTVHIVMFWSFSTSDFNLEDGGSMLLRKAGIPPMRLHGVRIQKAKILIPLILPVLGIGCFFRGFPQSIQANARIVP